jgi:hypothetical protein
MNGPPAPGVAPLLLGPDLLWAAALVDLLVFLGSVVVVAKAGLAYREHGSRPMLLLAIGLFLLLIGAEAFEVAGQIAVENLGAGGDRPSLAAFGSLVLVERLLRLGGVVALVGSLYVRE